MDGDDPVIGGGSSDAAAVATETEGKVPHPGDDPNAIGRLPREWQGKVRMAARTIAPLFPMYGWTYYDGQPNESRLINGLAHAVEVVLNGALGCRFGRWAVSRHQGEEGMDDEVSICLYLDGAEVEPIAWPVVEMHKKLTAVRAIVAEGRAPKEERSE